MRIRQSLQFAVFACAALLLNACAPKAEKTPLECAPKNTTAVMWVKADAALAEQMKSRPDYKQLVQALRENGKITKLLAEKLGELEKQSNGISALFVSKTDAIGSLEDLAFNFLDEFAAFTDSAEIASDKFNWTAVMRAKDERFVAKVRQAAEKEMEQSKGQLAKDGENYKLTVSDTQEIVFGFCGKYIVVAANDKLLAAAMEKISGDNSESVLDAPKFAKAFKNIKSHSLGLFIDSKIFPNGENFDALTANVDYFALVSDSTSLESGTAEFDVAFKKGAAADFVKLLKLENANEMRALPNSQMYFKSAFALSDEMLAQLAANPMAAIFAPVLKKLKSVEYSVNNFDPAKNALPTSLVNCRVDNADAVLATPQVSAIMNQSMFADAEIGGVKCKVSPVAAVVKTAEDNISVVLSPFPKDRDAAVKSISAKGELPQSDFFKSLKVPQNAVAKFYYDGLAFSGANAQQLPPNMATFSGLIGAYIKCCKRQEMRGWTFAEGDVLKTHMEAVGELDFTPLVEFVKNYK